MEEREMTMGQAINLALDQALAKDDRVFLLGEDIADPAGGVVGVTLGLSAKYGDKRVWDTPISEAAILGAAVGAGLNGFRPVAEIMFMDLIPIALDQILNHAAKMRFMTAGRLSSPLTLRTMVLGGMGMGTGATHSQSLEAWFMHIPGMKVVVPSNAADAKGLLTTAIFDNDPVLFVESGALYPRKGKVPVEEYSIPFGEAAVVRPGEDVTIVTYGVGVPESLAAAATLEEDGVKAEVIDLRTLVPLDVPKVVESVAKTRRAVVVHYATRFAGPGAEIAATITEQLFGQLAAPVGRVGAAYTPIPAASTIESAA
ncbi:MAG: alpha-ketoacid dehydrogenase subunit beta, partial [Acidimicrobiaceae bacterium]|nr:alpha-ketoacid dehydrogenase subunit beta [Acidimicrobiaceae bacterium]